jgi:hypothetical protein
MAAMSLAPPRTVLLRSILLLLAAAALTATWLGMNALFPGLRAGGIPNIVTRTVIHGAIMVGLWVGLSRTGLDRRSRVATWLAVMVPFSLWLVAVWWLAVAGAFRPRPGLPALPIAIWVPVLVGLAALTRSRRVAMVLDATPPSWLIGLQLYRVLGGIFLLGWARGTLSGVFALPAGIGDMTVGLLALPVAYYLRSGAKGGHAAAVAWNVLGLLDFAIAVGIGTLSAPGPLQLIVPNPPNLLLGTFPTVLVPAFAVPSSIILHGLSLWQLRRIVRRRAGTPYSAAAKLDDAAGSVSAGGRDAAQ